MGRRRAFVHRLPAAAPDDVSSIERAIAEGVIEPGGIVAILGKTEGNGCVNDFTRAFAVRSLRDLLARHLDPPAVAAVSLVMSGGTEGALAPHWIVMERRPAAEDRRGPALAIGAAHSPDLPFEHLGRRQQATMVAGTVRAAMADAGIERPGDVHFVQIKCPLLTAGRIAAAERQGSVVATRDTLKSMGLSRGASALGAALALGEVEEEQVTDAAVAGDMSLFASRAGTSGGVELLNHEVVVLGMSAAWSGPLAIDHAVMADAVDVEPVRAAMLRLGLPAARQLDGAGRRRLVALLAKAEAGTTGRLRGHRHTMLDDSDVSSTRHARAFVGGVLAGLVGHAELFVSGGAEHQGPDGGGPVAVIAERQGVPA